MTTPPLDALPLNWWQRSSRAFRNRNYRIYFLSQMPLVVGTWIHSIAMGWLLWRLTSSPWLLGLIAFVDTGPTFFLSPFTGTVIDRFNRRRILIVTVFTSFALMMTLALLSITGLITVEVLFAIALLIGINQAFMSPARQTILPELVPREDLPNAIALNSTMFNIARLIGPAVGGLVSAYIGEGWAFLIKAVSFLPLMFAIIILPIGLTAPKAQGKFFAEMARGFTYVRTHRDAFFILALVGLCSFTSVPYFSFLPMLADVILGQDASIAGLIMSVTGIGSVAAAITLTIQGSVTRLRFWPLFSSLLLGTCQIGVGFSSVTAVTLLLAVPIGFAILSQNLASNTILQDMAPNDLRGRIMAFYSMMMMGTVPLGSIVTGAVSSWIGFQPTMIIGGVLCVLGALAIHFIERGSRPDTSGTDSAPPHSLEGRLHAL